MMILSDFFSPKDPAHESELFSIFHLIFLGLSLILLIILLNSFKNSSKNSIKKYLRFMTFFIFILEVIKIIWETDIDILNGDGFNFGGLLPLYLCSMFIFTLPFASYGKKKVRRSALGFLASLGIVGGFSNLIFPQMLNLYPFFHFATFISLTFHFLMAFTGLLIVFTNYITLKKEDYYLAFIPTLIFALIVIPIAYYLESIGYENDYMLLLHGFGVPLLSNLGEILYNNNLQWLFTIIMMIVFYGITALMIFLMSKIQKFISKNKVAR